MFLTPTTFWNARHDYLSHLFLSRHLVFTSRAVDWSSSLGSVHYCLLADSFEFVVVAGFSLLILWVCFFGLVFVPILFLSLISIYFMESLEIALVA